MSLGKGEVIILSIKKKLNTRILNKIELVGACDILGLVLWLKYSIESQGYLV